MSNTEIKPVICISKSYYLLEVVYIKYKHYICIMSDFKKEFKFTLKDKKGKIYVETIVSFGSKEHPFPKDWEQSGMAQMAIIEFKERMLQEYFTVDVSEDLELSNPEK